MMATLSGNQSRGNRPQGHCPNIPRNRNIVSVLAHILLFSLSLLAAFVLAYNFARTEEWFFPQYMMALPVLLMIKYVVFSSMRQHQRSWRYVGFKDVFSTAVSCTLASALFYGVTYLTRKIAGGWDIVPWDISPAAIGWIVAFPDSVVLIDLLLSVVLVMAARATMRYYYEQGRSVGTGYGRTIIIGAGDAGVTLLREISHLPSEKYKIVGLLDDDHKKLGTRICGVEVLGSIDTVAQHCTTLDVEQVLIAMPSAAKPRIREIIQLLEGATSQRPKGQCPKVSIRIVPGLEELIEETVSQETTSEAAISIESQLRKVLVEDLLHRDPVVLDHQAIAEYVRGRKVLVTGGGGSIGSELCRQILKFDPARLILVELSENNLFDIERELRPNDTKGKLVTFLADICDHRRMRAIFEAEIPDIVCHAAAHKHVPMLEAHPGEGLKNNIVGTKTIADLSAELGVQKFVYISTDKAVNPTSIMGCTKRIAEMYVQGLDERTETQFITVRFGNVLASRGSVVPIFQEQIAKGGPVTVTHPDITRFFMTIPEAAQLVLQAGALGKGGEIFLLEMGEPIKIVDLAKNLITLSGLSLGVDINIEFTGLRPGEKLYEELYIAGEGRSSTEHPNISVWLKRAEDFEGLISDTLDLLTLADDADIEHIKLKLSQIVPEYQLDAPVGLPEKLVASS